MVGTQSQDEMIIDTQHLSADNEFNTSLEELDYIEVTPYWINQTNIDDIPQPESNNIKICIIDSGVKSDHIDLPSLSMNGYDNLYSGSWDQDSVGHGTHIAGIISAVNNGRGIRGAIDNENVDIHIEKLIYSSNANNSIISDDILIEAIEACANTGSKIINMSLSGGHYSEPLRNVIDRLTYNDDIVFVAAAGIHGNTEYSDAPAYPAAYKNVLAIGAVDINGDLASFSPHYNGISFVAPGVNILSTVNPDKNQVNAIYYENSNENYEFGFMQLDKGETSYPSYLPTQASCYYELPQSIVIEQVKYGKITSFSKENIDEAAMQCGSEGGEALVINYDYLSMMKLPEYDDYDLFLRSLDFDASYPTLLMINLSEEEIDFFREGNVKIDSGKNDYLALNGTSQAAGVATAGLAKIWSHFPNATSSELLNSVNNTAEKTQIAYEDHSYGNGLVNFGAAYQYLSHYQDEHIPAICPESWYENKDYQAGDSVTYHGIIYTASYQNKNQLPDTSDANSASWTETDSCSTQDVDNYNYNYNEDLTDSYQLSIEKITVTYKCESYSLACGGGFGGFSGFGFGGGGSGGSGYDSGGGGGGKKDAFNDPKRQKIYEDLKDRYENQPPQKEGERDKAYAKRMKAFYTKLSKDLLAFDKKYKQYKQDKHKEKAENVQNKANNFDRRVKNIVKHENNLKMRNAVQKSNRVCTATLKAAKVPGPFGKLAKMASFFCR